MIASVGRSSVIRGAGLGNEVIPWAKSYIAARALGHRLLKPQWELNRYGIAGFLGWSRAELLASRAAVAGLRKVEVTEEMFRSTGVDDYGDAMRALATANRFGKAKILVHTGTWGGYTGIAKAQDFLRQQILSAPTVLDRLTVLRSTMRTRIVIAMHVRLGDFGSRPPGAGEFNLAVPLSWFMSCQEEIAATLRGIPHETWVFSNGRPAQLAPLLSMPEVRLARRGNAVADLARLATADLLVCSVSSMSMLAAFLSSQHYVWYQPQLTRVDGALTIWGHEPAQRVLGSATDRAVSAGRTVGRGLPFAEGDQMPHPLRKYLEYALAMRDETSDLLYYGAVRPVPTAQPRCFGDLDPTSEAAL